MKDKKGSALQIGESKVVHAALGALAWVVGLVFFFIWIHER